MLLLFVIGSVVVGGSMGAPTGDKVGQLPNLNFQPTFAQYSGFLQGAQPAHHLHYWYTESQNSPSTDPVVLWLSGGPGCSSIGGLLDELGPFKVHDYGKVVVENVYTWNKAANMIYLESPVGVGYSYTTDGNITTNDDLTAADNHAALVDFFRKFPELQGRDFFVTGESYAGVYVPTLAVRLIQDQQNFPTFRGVAIGNPLLNYKLDVNNLIPLLYYHNLIDERTWSQLAKVCCKGVPSQCDYHNFLPQNTTTCGILTAKVYMIPFIGLDPYNLYYSCYANSNILLPSPRSIMHQVKLRKYGLNADTVQEEKQEETTKLPQCAHYNDSAVWMNYQATRTALNIPSFLPSWSDCNYALNEGHYHTQYDDMTSFIKKIISSNRKVLIYNGDVDTVCNAVANQRFVESLGQEVLRTKHPWNYTMEFPSTAGFRTQYQGIDFLTVRGSGHFVPTDKPREALQMLYNFMHGNDYSSPTEINTTPRPITPAGGFCNQPIVSLQYFGGPYTAAQLCQHGKCVNLASGAKCICDPSYTGPFCSQVNPNSPSAFVRLCALYATSETTAKGIPVGCPTLYTCLPYQQQCRTDLSCTYPVGYCLPWIRLNSLNPKLRDALIQSSIPKSSRS